MDALALAVNPPAARARRLASLDAATICLVVGEASCAGRFPRAVEAALDAGVVGVVQVREKDLDDDAFLRRAEALGRLAGRAGALLVLNDRVHLVAQAGADGAHVGEDDVGPERAREAIGPDAILGVSTHDAAEMRTAADRGADYVGLGPCFRSATKVLARAPGGPALVAGCVGATDRPWFPIGGVSPANAALLFAAGARRAAVGAGVLAADDPAAAVRAIARALGRGA